MVSHVRTLDGHPRDGLPDLGVLSCRGSGARGWSDFDELSPTRGVRMRHRRAGVEFAIAAALAAAAAGCGGANKNAGTIGVAFETLQTEYWVASRNAIEAELKKRNLAMLEAIADGDANRQLEQVRNFVARRVDGIILVPKDAQTPIPMIRQANAASIPIVLFNRPPAPSDAKAVSVVADNLA